MSNNQDTASLVDLIYAAALDEQQWIAVITRLAEAIGGGIAVFVRKRLDDGQGRAILAGIDAAGFSEYFGYFARRNPLAKSIGDRGTGAFLIDWQMLPKDELMRSEYYNDFLRPRGIHGSLGLMLWRSEQDAAVMTLTRGPQQEEFGPADVARLQHLMPHLRRAVLLSRRLPPGALIANMLASVFDTWHEATILIGPDAQIRYANRAADTLLSRGDGLTTRMSRLGARDNDASHRLLGAIRLAARDDGAAMGSALTIPRGFGIRPYAVFVAPVPRQAGFLWTAEPSALAVIVDLASNHHPDPASLAEMLGLSRAQATVATMLADGHEPREIAVTLKLSTNTVRRHVSDILHRTDTHRQTDLVRLLGQLVPRTNGRPEPGGNGGPKPRGGGPAGPAAAASRY